MGGGGPIMLVVLGEVKFGASAAFEIGAPPFRDLETLYMRQGGLRGESVCPLLRGKVC
jgi:hypothetical protein